MSASTELIKELRETTGAGVLDCKKALDEAGGDMEKAAAILHERGLAKAAKKADRETEAGVLDMYSHGEGRVGVMVEVNCETDFVARTDEFREFAHEMALQVAATSPQWVGADEVPEDVLAERRAAFTEEALGEGKPEDVVERIVEGRMAKFLGESCLLGQAYIRDDSKMVEELLKETVAAIGENIQIRRFVRWEVAEEIA
ncbi:MAG: translation elongation factor Ts [Anaerolineales bacterium]